MKVDGHVTEVTSTVHQRSNHHVRLDQILQIIKFKTQTEYSVPKIPYFKCSSLKSTLVKKQQIDQECTDQFKNGITSLGSFIFSRWLPATLMYCSLVPTTTLLVISLSMWYLGFHG